MLDRTQNQIPIRICGAKLKILEFNFVAPHNRLYKMMQKAAALLD